MFRTERLKIRDFCEADMPLIYEINNHAECIRFNGWESMSLEDCKATLKKWMAETQSHDGYGVYCVENEKRQPIGMTFIMKYEWTNDFEIGFRLKRDEWDKGYATELTKYWIHHAQNILQAHTLCAEVAGLNERSLKIFRNLSFEESEHPDGGDGKLFTYDFKLKSVY